MGNQAVRLTNADTWHRAGYLGQGIKVGVIDIGFAKFAELQDAGELPEEVIIRCDGWTRNTKDMSDCGNWFDTATHGTAVAESLMDIAPEATLYVGELDGGSRKYPIVEWMIEEGVDVINYSITNGFEGPGDGTSPYWDSMYAAIDLAVESGAVWVNIAGNGAEKTWYGQFQPTEVSDDEGNTIVVHNFGTADDLDFSNDIQLEAGERIIADLRQEEEDWSDPKCGLGLYLYDTETGDLLADSYHLTQRDKNEFTLDYLYWTREAENPNADYDLRVQVDEECEEYPEWIQIISYIDNGLGPASEGGHMVTPADSTNPGMLTVGAAPYYDTMTVEPYSNRGPTVDGRIKPDVVGVDCARITIRVPFARGEEQCWMQGTSQASPHVAGLVALAMQRFAGDEAYDTPAEIVSYIQDSAIQRDITPEDPDTFPDPNNVWGHGFAVLEALDVIEYDVDDDGLIEISTLAQLDAVRYDLDGDGIVDPASRAAYLGAFTKAVDGMGCPPTTGCTGYELTGDLDFDSDGDGDVDADDHDGAWWNSGRGWEPIGDGLGGPSRNYRPGGYWGVFEGNGHTVSNLLIANRIPAGTTDDREPTGYFGLFGEILPGGEVRNLNITGVSVSVEGPAGWYTSDGYFNHGGYYAGGLAGESHGAITNVHVTGTVTADGAYDDAGGLVGRNTGTITDSSAEVTVTAGDDAGGLVGESYSHRATIHRSSADGTVTGEGAGGLVGTATNVTITDSYAHGSATGDDAAGLVAAAWFSTITNSYATTAITGTRDTGGLVADGDLNTITNSYWDTTTTGQTSSLGSPDTAAKTTTELQQDTETAVDAADYTGIYSGWPKTTWDFGLNCHYPTIQTDTDTQPATCPSTNTDITDTDKAEGAAASSIDDDHNQEPETDDDRDQEPEQITETDPTPQKPAPVVIAPVFRAPPPSSSNPSPAPDKDQRESGGRRDRRALLLRERHRPRLLCEPQPGRGHHQPIRQRRRRHRRHLLTTPHKARRHRPPTSPRSPGRPTPPTSSTPCSPNNAERSRKPTGSPPRRPPTNAPPTEAAPASRQPPNQIPPNPAPSSTPASSPGRTSA